MLKAGLLGKKLGHSLSPFIHKALGCDYSLFEVQPQALKDFVTSCELDGFNVTIPYKRDIIPFLDEVDENARNIGAVNTVCRRNGKLIGYNTDADGMIYALKRVEIEIDDKVVAILGTGGTSETASFVAKKLEAKLVLRVGRTSEINYTNIYQQNIDVIINTTPLGMFPDTDSCAVDLSKMPTVKAVFDAVYNPLCTRLVCSAKELGMKATNGLAMLVEQARLSHNLFASFSNANQSETELILNKLYKTTLNLIFIGMPGSGKSSLAKAVSESLKLPLIDLDRVISEKYDTPEQLILNRGEGYFRQLERNEAHLLDGVRGSVISLGGGTPMNEDTAREIKRNGKVILVNRNLSMLDSSNRPITAKCGIEELFKVRQPVFERLCDYVAKNDNFENTVKGIIKYYENLTY